jgi:hypothetical protein
MRWQEKSVQCEELASVPTESTFVTGKATEAAASLIGAQSLHFAHRGKAYLERLYRYSTDLIGARGSVLLNFLTNNMSAALPTPPQKENP